MSPGFFHSYEFHHRRARQGGRNVTGTVFTIDAGGTARDPDQPVQLMSTPARTRFDV